MDDHNELKSPCKAPSGRVAARRNAFPETVIDLIASQAARTPDRLAVTWSGGAPWTYERLLDEANAIACRLVEEGVAPGELVGVSLPRRPEMIAAVLGVMRAGAAYVALDPAFPETRLRYMAGHAGIRQVLAWRNGAELPGLPAGCRRLALEGFDPATAPAVTLPQSHGEDLAYVLYTSGSTGLPKGVRILQRNLTNFLASMRQAPGITDDDVLCAVTTLSFDIAALELYLPLLVGARIVVATEDEQADPVALASTLRRHGVTMLQTTPTLLRLLVNSDRVHEVRGMKLLVGGEALPRDLAETILPVCSELWNMYGPTETTVWSTIHPVTRGSGPVPLGKPIAETAIHVLDENRQPVAEGEIGEIWIGGAGVADGYLHDPEKTAERFLPDPFATDGSRMYRTGDLGSLHDGVLYFHGRVDEQIKLRGFRIEPGDIEAAALAVDGVRETVAVARDFGDGDKRLVLYLVGDPDPRLVTRLRAGLRDRLPDYMRPQFIEVLDALPRTPNGKIDRKALPLPRVVETGATAASAPGHGQLESALTGIWSELLKVRDIGPHDDFFELGGDSLLAVRVFERMQALTGVNLPLSTLLTGPTIAQQAAAFRAAGAGAGEPAAASPVAAGSDDKWSPLVPIQARGTRPPLFLVHAIGGNVLNYVPLARGLGADQPVYALQAIGLDGITPPVASLSTMAACYVAEIRRVQPHGPYYLGGGSMGGLIAYEMARQLREQGHPVGLLAMMDTYGPGCADVAAKVNAPSPARILLAPLGRLRRALDRLRVQRARAAGRPLPHALCNREIERVHYRALREYRPQSYPGKIVLFRACEQSDAARHDETLGWSTWVQGGIEVIGLPGSHDNLIEQPELLRQLRIVLGRAQHHSTSSR